jgi:transcription initiation factor TFIID subunit 1
VHTSIAHVVRDVPNGKPIQPLAPRNDLLEAGDWIKDVIWDAGRVSPSLLESDEDEGESETTAQKKALVLTAKSKLDPFNMSNDHLYEHTREARFRIRQTFGAIEVFHAGPAKALQMPFVRF